MTATVQERVNGNDNGNGRGPGGAAEAGDDGDNYGRIGAAEAELYANNPSVTSEPAPNGETYGVVDVSARSRRALGGAAFEGFQSDRIMPRRLLPQVGRFAIGPVELN